MRSKSNDLERLHRITLNFIQEAYAVMITSSLIFHSASCSCFNLNFAGTIQNKSSQLSFDTTSYIPQGRCCRHYLASQCIPIANILYIFSQMFRINHMCCSSSSQTQALLKQLTTSIYPRNQCQISLIYLYVFYSYFL